MDIKRRPGMQVVTNIVVVVCIVLIIAAYRFDWRMTGFEGKTVWDWLQLIIVPIALGIVALLFNQSNANAERNLADLRHQRDVDRDLDKHRENLLQRYNDYMCMLSLEKGLFTSEPDSLVRLIARDRSTAVLTQLDGQRAAWLFRVFREAQGVNKVDPLVDLNNTDFHNVEWIETDMSKLFLHHVDLRGANLQRTNFTEIELDTADLSRANLRDANFLRANLTNIDFANADLRHVNFKGAESTNVCMSGAHLQGACFLGAKFCNVNLKGAHLDRDDLSPEQVRQVHFS